MSQSQIEVSLFLWVVCSFAALMITTALFQRRMLRLGIYQIRKGHRWRDYQSMANEGRMPFQRARHYRKWCEQHRIAPGIWVPLQRVLLANVLLSFFGTIAILIVITAQ